MTTSSSQDNSLSKSHLVDVYIYGQRLGSGPKVTISVRTIESFSNAAVGVLSPTSEPTSYNLLSDRVAHQTYQWTLTEQLDLRLLRQSAPFTVFEQTHGVEIVLLPRTSKPRPLRLAVFDMDSTLIDQEVIDELARTIGKTEYVSGITERAMRGELDFSESLKARVTMLHGVRSDVWKTLESLIDLAPGAEELCSALKSHGVVMAVFSGGFQPMAEWVKAQLDLDIAVANHLVSSPPTDDVPYNHLTGELKEEYPIIGAAKKRELLVELAAKHSIPLSEVLCVGDGANDLDMLNAVGAAGGVAVACRAKPMVQQEAPNRLNTGTLADLLYLFDLHHGTISS